MSPYEPDSQFSMNSLDRLEATGIQIFTSLCNLRTELVDILGVDKLLSISRVISEWVSGKSSHPPTWRTLLSILRKLDLGELSQQIEDYLSSELVHMYTLYNLGDIIAYKNIDFTKVRLWASKILIIIWVCPCVHALLKNVIKCKMLLF